MMLPRNFESVRAEQNRANAAHSTGPVTPAGKQTSSGNAVKHGLSGKAHACLPGEREAFEKHVQSYLDHLAPAGPQERDLAVGLAENYWRLRRAHAMESALFEQVVLEKLEEEKDAHPASAHAQAWVDATKGLQRLALYAIRIQRAIDKDSAELKSLQAERKAAFAQAQEEAILLTRLAQSKGQTFDPAPHFPVGQNPAGQNHGGFVYSSAEIARIMLHTRRLEEARQLLNPNPIAALEALM